MGLGDTEQRGADKGGNNTQLAKIIVATAVLSDRKEDYIAMIQELSPSSQTEMMNILNEV